VLTLAMGVEGNEQVGYGMRVGTGSYHALLWQGSAGSVVDLHPFEFGESMAAATNGINQVGRWVSTSHRAHALVWSGSATSFVDLQSYLPSIYPESEATDIDALGNIVGIAYDIDGTPHAVAWLVPEPASIWLVLLSGLIAAWRRQRRVASLPI
jgi:hypothetical protein